MQQNHSCLFEFSILYTIWLALIHVSYVKSVLSVIVKNHDSKELN